MTWALRYRTPDHSEEKKRQAPPVQTDSHLAIGSLGEWRSVQEHAQALIERLAQHGLVSGSVLATDLQRMHILMCNEHGWLRRPWAPISKQLRLRSGGRKSYAWIAGRRRRVFSLQKLATGSDPLSASPHSAGKNQTSASQLDRDLQPVPLK